LGDTDRSLNAYSELANKKNIIKDLPVDIIRVHNSAGKLYFEDGHADKSVASFRQAVKEAETRHDDEQKHVAELNLANALSSVGMSDEAMELYDKLVSKKALKLSKIFFLALVNKSALLLTLGQVEDAYKILCNIEDTHSANADDVRVRVYLLLGSVALANGQFNAARSYFEDSLDVADDDLSSIVQAKKGISLSHLLSMQYERAINTLDDLLADVSAQSAESKSAKIIKAEIWNLMAQVYKKQGSLLQAKNFAKLGETCLSCVFILIMFYYFPPSACNISLMIFVISQLCKHLSQFWARHTLPRYGMCPISKCSFWKKRRVWIILKPNFSLMWRSTK
jgi:tetratricopeptide (TPR) repeat protein